MYDVVMDKIPFHIERDKLFSMLKMDNDSDESNEIIELLIEAEALGRPKALYTESFIDSKNDETVIIDGKIFTSRILRVNFDSIHRVFPFVATCGIELENWSNSINDYFKRYVADTIKQMALGIAVNHLSNHIKENKSPGKLSSMRPGSLEDWPLSEQKPLFTLFEDCKKMIGVELTESFLMIPIKSVSGIYFPTEVSFESCQLCSRENCPGRSAPYDNGLYGNRYSKS